MHQNEAMNVKTSYKRVINKGPLQHWFMRISLEFEHDNDEMEISTDKLKSVIMGSLKSLYGDVGASIMIDILKYSPQKREAILRMDHGALVRVWSSLTLCGFVDGMVCAFRVHQVSPYLMALSVNSRSLDFGVI